VCWPRRADGWNRCGHARRLVVSRGGYFPITISPGPVTWEAPMKRLTVALLFAAAAFGQDSRLSGRFPDLCFTVLRNRFARSSAYPARLIWEQRWRGVSMPLPFRRWGNSPWQRSAAKLYLVRGLDSGQPDSAPLDGRSAASTASPGVRMAPLRSCTRPIRGRLRSCVN